MTADNGQTISSVQVDGVDVPMDGQLGFNFSPFDNGNYIVRLTANYLGDAPTSEDDVLLHPAQKTIVVENVEPSLDAGADRTVDEGSLINLGDLMISDPGTNDTHIIAVDWGDDSGIQTFDLGDFDGTVADIQHAYADDGEYVVLVELWDDDMSMENNGVTDSFTVAVLNVAPTVEAGDDLTVDEGQTLVLISPLQDPIPGFGSRVFHTVSFNDPGTLDTHAATIDWGDGTVEDGVVIESPFRLPGFGFVSGSHVYADDGVYTVTVMVTDDEKATASDSLSIRVDNAAPVIGEPADQAVVEGEIVKLEGVSFVDPGTLDTHTATIDWGDGTSLSATVTELGGAGSVSGSHAYEDNDVYTVIVTVTDDDGAATSANLMITVDNVAPLANPDSYTANEDELLVVVAPGVLENDVDVPADVLSATLLDLPIQGTLLLQADGSFTYTPAADFNGADGFTYQVADDDGGVSEVTQVNLELLSVNDAPTFVGGPDQLVDENAGPQIVVAWASDISAGPANEAKQCLAFEIQVDDPSLFAKLPSLDLEGTLSFEAAAHAFGTANVTVVLTDDGGTERGGQDTSDPQTFTITVNEVNEAPVVQAVRVSGTSWGASRSPHSIPIGTDQLQPLPWVNINQVQILFSEDVVVQKQDLSLRGVNVPSYTFLSADSEGFNYNPVTFTATWTVDSSIAADKLIINVNADGPDPVRDVVGKPLGGDFQFLFNVLPGDVDGDDAVNLGDALEVLNAVPNDSSANLRADTNGDGSINFGDALAVLSRVPSLLPSGDPILVSVSADVPDVGRPLALASATDTLVVVVAPPPPTAEAASGRLAKIPDEPLPVIDPNQSFEPELVDVALAEFEYEWFGKIQDDEEDGFGSLSESDMEYDLFTDLTIRT